MEKVAVYPGSFDPVTNGHLDVLERASRIFDRVIVAVVHNVYKNPLFSTEERVEMLREVTRHLPNLEVDSFTGLLVNYVRKRQATAIVRGLRTVSDFEYELQLAMTNSHLYPEVDTIFIACNSKYYFVSSTGVKEAALLGGSVCGLVPPLVEEKLQEKLLKFKKG
ncbi:MAG: pantetheine-phosphate adenylyltransferase [Syntrophomonadaceae bacterium]|jgi:pantetheine-phosphate adenylyltransferase|nr:pantetheine-phosphate adenylyltransferase [Syntrophomonadaceae bacterium]